MKKSFLVLVILSVYFISGCGKKGSETSQQPPVGLDPAQISATQQPQPVQGMMGQIEPFVPQETPQQQPQLQQPQFDVPQFDVVGLLQSLAFENYAKLAAAKEGKSFVFSPSAVAWELGVLLTGTQGNSTEEIQRIFKFPVTPPTLSQLLNQEISGVGSFWMFNAVWVQKDYPVLEKFIGDTGSGFMTSVFSADLTGAKEESLKLINTWASDMTGEKVPTIVVDYPEETRLLMTNILLHRVNWKEPFHIDKTADREFTSISGEKSMKPMMYKAGTFNYLETPDLQLLVLPYQEANLRLVILAPVLPEKFDELEKLLTPQYLLQLFGNVQQTPLQMRIPLLMLESETDITSLLPAISKTPNLKGMSQSELEPIDLGPMIQKTVLKLEEQGVTPTPPPQEPVVDANSQVTSFAVNRPFFFVVWNTQTMTPMIMGRVLD